MNKLCCLIIMFITCEICKAQNLVPNPSFEDTLQCPNFPQPTINYALYWSSYGGTPDYLNPCANIIQPLWGVPNNLAGYQYAYSGNSYAGLITWYVSVICCLRENMGVQLIQPLVIGTKYFASCYISNGDSSQANSSSNKF